MNLWWRRRVLLPLGLLVSAFALLFAAFWWQAWGAQLVYRIVAQQLPDTVSLAAPEGSFGRGLTVEHVRLHAAGSDIELRALALKLNAMPLVLGRISIAKLDIQEMLVVVGEEPRASTTETQSAPFAMPIDVVLHALNIQEIRVAQADELLGTAQLAAAASVTGSQLDVASLVLSDADSHWTLSGQFDWSRMSAEVQTGGAWLIAEMPVQAKAELSGVLNAGLQAELELVKPVRLRASARSADGKKLYASIVWPAQRLDSLVGASMAVDPGQLEMSGPLDALAVALQTPISYAEQQATVELSGELQGFESFAGSLAVQAPALSLDSDVVVDSRESAPTVSLDGELAVSPSAWDKRWPNGSIRAPVMLRALVTAQPSVSLQLAEINGEIEGHTVTGELRANISERVVDLRSLRISLGANEFTASGQWQDGALNGTGEIDAPELAALGRGLGGQVALSTRVSGTHSAPSIELDARASAVRANDYKVDELEVTLSPTASAAHRLALTGGNLETPWLRVQTLELDGQLGSEQQAWQVSARGPQTRLSGKFRTELNDQAKTLHIDSLDMLTTDFGAFALVSPSTAQVSAGRIQIAETCLQGDAGSRACTVFDWSGDRGRLGATVTAFPFELLPLSRNETWGWEGRLNARLDGRYEHQVWDGQFAFSSEDGALLSAAANGEILEQSFVLDGRFSSTNGEIVGRSRLEASELGHLNVEISAQAQGPGNSPNILKARWQVPDVSQLDPWVDAVAIHSGAFSGDATIRNPLQEPSVALSAVVQNTSMTVQATGTEIEQLTVTASSTANGQIGIDGRLGKGGEVLTINATLDPNLTEPSLRGRLAGAPMPWLNADDLTLVLAPDLEFDMRRDQLVINGQIDVPSARIRLTELPTTATSMSPDIVVHREVAVSETEAAFGFAANVAVELGDDVEFDGFGLTTGLQGRLQLETEQFGELAGVGQLDLIGGQFLAYGQQLAIDEGRLVFSGALDNPTLDIEAVRDVSVGRVGIRLSGNVDTPSSTLFSEPVMSDARTLAFLISGRDITASAADNDALNNAAISLGLERVNAITAELGARLGVDSFAVGGTGESREIFAGKWVSPDVYIQYGVGLFDRVGSFLIKYKLNSRLTLETQTGRAQSLDVVYTVGDSVTD